MEDGVTRAEYLAAGRGAHRAYYAQFVTSRTISQVVAWIGPDVLREHRQNLEEVPLFRWDQVAAIAPHAAVWQQVNDYPTKAGLVCIVKEAAHQWLEGGAA